MFLYASTLSLYNVFISCFNHITLKETYKKIEYNHSKYKILKYTIINIIIVSLLFVSVAESFTKDPTKSSELFFISELL